MLTATSFIIGIFTSLAISASVLVLISSPLLAILEELCLTEKQARFWLAWSRAMFLLTPMLLVLLAGNFSTTDKLLLNESRALMAALAGVLVGLIVLGQRIFEPALRRKDNGENQ